jgi:hypothetical protein
LGFMLSRAFRSTETAAASTLPSPPPYRYGKV